MASSPSSTVDQLEAGENDERSDTPHFFTPEPHHCVVKHMTEQNNGYTHSSASDSSSSNVKHTIIDNHGCLKTPIKQRLEARKSAASSGIGPDASPRTSLSSDNYSSRTSLSSSNFSPCVSVSSLEDDDLDSLPDDVVTNDHIISIIVNPCSNDFKRASSMHITPSPAMLNTTDFVKGRSVSLDEEHSSISQEDEINSETNSDNVTIIHINPGEKPRVFPSCRSLDKDVPSSKSFDLDPAQPDKRDDVSGCERKQKINSKVKLSNGIGLKSSLINITSNPGYIKFIDEQMDEDVSLLNNNNNNNNNNHSDISNDEMAVKQIEKNDSGKYPGYEVGVKFIDGDGDSICSSLEYSNDEEESKEKSKAPDGGWGWVIVGASFFISMIADGISFSFGLLYIEFLQYFGESSSKTSLIGSLFMSVPLLTGPISSALVDRYGCRTMTIIGGLIAGLGFVLSAFQTSIEMMYLTFGLIAGLGLGLCYVTAVVSIAYWFDKKRTFATGLGACGTGFGTVVYARMTSYFIAEYGWRGTTLLLAGTFFNMCVGGALMRDPEWWTLEQNKAASLAGTKSIRAASSCGSVSGLDFPGVDELKRMLRSGEAPEYLLTSLATSTATGEKASSGATGDGGEGIARNKSYRSVVNLPTFVRQSEKVPLEVLESLSANKRVYNVILENYPSLLLCRSVSDGSKLNAVPDGNGPVRVPVTMSMRVKAATKNKTTTTPETGPSPVSPDTSVLPLLQQPSLSTIDGDKETAAAYGTMTPKSPPPEHKSILSKSVQRTDSLPAFKKQYSTTTPSAHYLRNIRVHRNSVMYRGAMLNIHRYRLRASSCPDIYRNSMTTIAKENEEKWYADMIDLFHGMIDFSMFLELHFLLMSIATILLFTWFIVPYFYLADHASLNNYDDDQVANLLMIIGITNFFGMVGLGWAGDQPWMNVTKTYAFCLVICGLATMAMPYFTSTYWLLTCSCGLFGLFFASSFSFTPVILVQLIPLERFTTAYGLSLMCQGIGSLVGPPLAGWIYDMTHTYDLSFYMAGVWIIVAGILMALIPMTRNRKIWGNGPIEKDKVSLSDNRDSSCA